MGDDIFGLGMLLYVIMKTQGTTLHETTLVESFARVTPHITANINTNGCACMCVCVHPDSKLRAMVNTYDCKAGGGSRVQSLPPTKTLWIPW